MQLSTVLRYHVADTLQHSDVRGYHAVGVMYGVRVLALANFAIAAEVGEGRVEPA